MAQIEQAKTARFNAGEALKEHRQKTGHHAASR
jgi:hypothetical protein